MLSLPITQDELDALLKLASIGIRQQTDDVLFALSPLLAKLRQTHTELSQPKPAEPT